VPTTQYIKQTQRRTVIFSHWTETALLELLNVYTAGHSKHFTIAVTFDNIRYSTLLERLKTESAISDSAPRWLQS